MKHLLALPLLLLLMAVSMVSRGQTVTVSTDQDDYYPGQWVIITGSGWQNDTDVQLTLTHLDPLPDPIHAHEAWLVQPNEEGYIYYEWFVEDQELNTSFQLDALGLTTGLNATTYFTDGDKVGSVYVGVQSPNPVVAGDNATYNITVKRDMKGGDQHQLKVFLSISTPLPPGVDASFSSNPVSFTSVQDYNTVTLTLTTDASITPAGTTTFTVKAQTTLNDFKTYDGILVIKHDPVLTWNNPSDITYGTTLGATQLNATANVAGTYVYSPAAGTMLNSGNGQTLSVTFTPNDQNYNTISKSVLINVAKANQAITWNNPANIVYGTPLSATQLNATVAGVTGGTATGALTYAPTVGTLLNAGSQILQVSAAATSNYNAASKEVTLIVDKAPSATVVSVADVPFDGVAHGATAAVTGAGDLNLPLTVTYTGVAPTVYAATTTAPTNAGTYLAAASFAGDDNHLASSDSKTFTIHKAPSTTLVTIAGGPFTYTGSAITPATVSVTGAGGLNLTPTASYASNINAGTATASYAYAGDDNHLGSNDSKAFDIGKASSTTVVSIAEGTFTYTGAAITPATVTVSGANLSLTPAASYANNINAGTATASYTYAGDDNHYGSNDNKTFDIGKANATIMVVGYTGIYDGAAHGATGSAKGVNEETLQGLDLGASFTNVPGGTATWVFTDQTGNYQDGSGQVAIVINKASSTTAVSAADATYNGNAHEATASVKGAGGLDLPLTVTYTGVAPTVYVTSETAPTNAGTYLAAASYAGDLNHESSNDSKPFTINQAVATISVVGGTWIYDATEHGASIVTAQGVVGDGENLSAFITLGAKYTDVPGGVAHWSFSNPNYVAQSGDVSITIKKADAEVTVNGYSGVYDALSHGASGTATGVGGVNLAGGLSLGNSFTDYPGGTAHWTFTGGTNYLDESGDVAIKISKAVATIQVNGYEGTFDAAAHGATFVSATGVNNANLAASVSVGTDTYTNYPGGKVAWSFENNNYLPQSGSVDITINKADANVTVNGYSRVYDGAAHGATGAAVGVAGDPTAAGSTLNLGSSFTDYPGGTAHWTFTGGTNYLDESGDVAIDISKAAATIQVQGYEGTYDAAAHGATLVSATGVNNANLASSVTVGTDTYTNYPGGKVAWSFENNNYLPQSGSVDVTINKADANVTVNGYSGVYDGAAHGATGSAVGVAGDPTAAGSTLNLGLSFTDYPGGTAHWTFTGGTNYLDESGDVAIKISKAAATISVIGYEGTYDGAAHGATLVSATGVNNANLASSVSVGTDTYTNYPGGKVAWSFENNNYLPQSGSVDIVINKADVDITVTGYTGIYDGAAHGATGSARGVKNELLAGLNLGDSFTNVPGGTINWFFTDETGNYKDESGLVNIDITKAESATSITILGAPFTYTGSAIAPASVSVTGAGGLHLTPDPVYANNIQAGTASVSYDYPGDINHFGSKDSKTFTIGKASSTTTVSINGGPFTYTGSNITPATVSVTGAGGLSLTPTANYANNINAGTATASYTYDGDDNHFGSGDSQDFEIGKANSITVVSITGAPFTYSGAAITPATVSVTGAGGLNLAPAPLYGNNVNAGTATASFTYAGDDNHFGSGDSENFDIGKANAVIVVNTYNFVYDGLAHTSTYTAVGVETPTPADLSSLMTVSGTTHTNAGNYTGDSWSFAGNANYNATSGIVNNEIQPRPITITADAKSKYCGQLDPALTAQVTTGMIMTGDYATGKLSLASTESTNLFSIVKGTYTFGANYAETYLPANFTIKSAGIDASASSTAVQSGTSTSTLIKATVTDYSNPDIKVEGAKVTFIVTDSSNSVKLNQEVQTGFGGIASFTIYPGSWGIGVYAVKAVVGNGCEESYGYLTIFDATSSFVTGGGWISSLAGAYTKDGTLTGKANFGFVSKYKKGSNLVDGNTEFQFNAGDFNFKSSAHDPGTLVISGYKATYRGIGTVNGIGNYGFMVTAIDGEITGSGGYDKFRIKIWDKTNGNKVVYDNQIGELENTEASTKLGGGSIVIHSNENKPKVAQILPDASASTFEPTLKVYPNPFTERLNIEFSYVTDTKAKLEIYSVTGAKLQTLYDGPVTGGQLYNFEYIPRLVSSQVVFYHLTLDGKTQVGKILFNERR